MVKRNILSTYQRKTARVLALEAANKVKKEQQKNSCNTALTRRTLKMKRLDELVPTVFGPKSQQNEDMISHEAPHFGKAIFPIDQQIPDKEILEIVIDILQRKDKYRYFAEPVDGNEVEDYYDFIKEPMDFGTMRAKLNKGLYTTLKQFQDDVYLICKNAMSFNASSTVYYRKARSINELADKTFSTLETDPENIIAMFSKRKISRQISKYEAENSGAEHGDNVKRKRSARCRSTVWKNVAFNEAELRHMYQHPTSREDTYFSSGKQLVPAGEKVSRGLGYKESLTQFVKDLGPVAQKVANQKLMSLNKLQSRSLTVQSLYESRENVNHEYNVATNPSPPLAILNTDRIRKGKMVLGADSFNHRHRETNYLAQMDSARTDPIAQKDNMVVGADTFDHRQNETNYLALMQSVRTDPSVQKGKMVIGADIFENRQKEANYLALMQSVRTDPRTQHSKMMVGADSFDHRQKETNYLPLIDSIRMDPSAKKGNMAVEAGYFNHRQTETNHLPLMSSVGIDMDRYGKGKMVLGVDSFGHDQTKANFLPKNLKLPSFVGTKPIVYPSRVVPEYNLSLSGNMFQPSYNFSQTQQQLLNPSYNQFPGLQHIGRSQDLRLHLPRADRNL